MRILFICRSLDPGGAERQLVTLASSLDGMGHEVGIATFYSGGSLEKHLTGSGIKLLRLNKKGRWDAAAFFIRTVKAARSFKPDIIHGYMSTANILSVMVRPFLGFKCKSVFGVRSSDMDLSRYDWLWKLAHGFETWLSRYADLLIANSTAGLEHSRQSGFSPGKAIVISNGIDVSQFYPDPAAGQALRMGWKISPGEKVVGVVARIDPMKDYPNFFRASAIVLGKQSDVRFVCVGKGEKSYENAMRREASAAGLGDKIIFAGSRADMLSVYNAFDTLVLPSINGEGFPNVVGEAMACGTPCVVTDVGDAAHVVGDAGIAVPKGDSAVLAGGIMKILGMSGQEKEKLSATGRERIASFFTVQKMASSTSAALESIL